MRAWVFGLCVALTPSVAWAHGASKSYADWTVEGDQAALRLSLAAHDVIAARPEMDPNGDRRLDASELESERVAYGATVVEQTRVRAGRAKASATCTPGDAIVRGIGDPVEELQVTVVYTCPSAIGALELGAGYLPELEPPHATLATVTGGEVSAQHVFTAQDPRFGVTFELPPLAEELLNALLAGLKANFVPGPLLFCLGLILSRRGRRFGGILAAFLAAHSVMVFFGGLRYPFLPLIVAAAIAWIGLETFLSAKEPEVGWHHIAMAVVFGALFGVMAHLKVPREMMPKLAYVAGATAPLLGTFLVGRIVLAVSGSHTERVVRGIGAGILASALVLAVLHFV